MYTYIRISEIKQFLKLINYTLLLAPAPVDVQQGFMTC